MESRAETPSESEPSLLDWLALRRLPGAVHELDGLRGIAILLVLMRHASNPFHDAEAAGWSPILAFRNGWAGVDLFFVLSGFLVTYHLSRRWQTAPSGRIVLNYFAKRFFRIVPTYYVWMLLVLFGLHPFYRPVVDDVWYELWTHLLFLQDYTGSRLVVAFWSLGVEEKYYLIAPVLVLLLQRLSDVRARIGVLMGLSVVPSGLRLATWLSSGPYVDYTSSFWGLRSPFHLAVDTILVGAITALLYQHREAFPALLRRSTQHGLFLGGAAVALVLLVPFEILDEPIDLVRGVLVFPVLAYAFAAIQLSLLLGTGPWTSLFRSKWLFYLSKLSYALYLVHMTFIPVSEALCKVLVPGWEGLPPLVQLGAFLVPYFSLSIVASLLLHYSVEKPSLWVKDHVLVKP
jgi:peptidoglycan/LPS O-acetylase OafA/YrhL